MLVIYLQQSTRDALPDGLIGQIQEAVLRFHQIVGKHLDEFSRDILTRIDDGEKVLFWYDGNFLFF